MKLKVRNTQSTMLEKEIYTVTIYNTIDDTSVSHIKQPSDFFKKYCNPASLVNKCIIVSTNNIFRCYPGLNTTIRYKVKK